MRLSSDRIPKYSVLIILLLSLSFTSSCSFRSSLLGPFAGPGPSVAPGSTLIRDWLAITDHRDVARRQVASDFAETRLRPATTVTGKKEMNLADCRALALANNMEIRAARLTEITHASTARGQFKRILPKIVYTGDYSYRDNPSYGYSNILGLSEQSPILNPWWPKSSFGDHTADGSSEKWTQGGGVGSWSRGREQTTSRNAIEMSWSPTEAAQNYYLSRNTGNQKMGAHYQRVRKAQEIIGALDQAYFRLLALQEAIPQAMTLVSVSSGITRRHEALQRQGLVSSEQYYGSRDREVRARLALSQLQNDLGRQRNILARAMGISPDYSVDGGFSVVGKLERQPGNGAPTEADLWDMERLGVQYRPEIYQATLEYLTASNEVKRTIMRYCPEITGFWRYTKDDDKFSYNNDYKEIGVRARVDLLNWFGNISDVLAARFKRESGETAIGALVSITVSQVRDAALKYFDDRDRAISAAESLRNAEGTLETARRQESKGALTQVAVEQARSEVLSKRIELQKGIGEAYASLAQLDSVMATNYNEPQPQD